MKSQLPLIFILIIFFIPAVAFVQTPLSKLTGIELLLAALYRQSDLFPKE